MHVVLDLGERISQNQQTAKQRHPYAKEKAVGLLQPAWAADVLTDDLSALLLHHVPGRDSPASLPLRAF